MGLTQGLWGGVSVTTLSAEMHPTPRVRLLSLPSRELLLLQSCHRWLWSWRQLPWHLISLCTGRRLLLPRTGRWLLLLCTGRQSLPLHKVVSVVKQGIECRRGVRAPSWRIVAGVASPHYICAPLHRSFGLVSADWSAAEFWLVTLCCHWLACRSAPWSACGGWSEDSWLDSFKCFFKFDIVFLSLICSMSLIYTVSVVKVPIFLHPWSSSFMLIIYLV